MASQRNFPKALKISRRKSSKSIWKIQLLTLRKEKKDAQAAEAKMLRVARRLAELGLDVRTTYLGAHAIPVAAPMIRRIAPDRVAVVTSIG